MTENVQEPQDIGDFLHVPEDQRLDVDPEPELNGEVTPAEFDEVDEEADEVDLDPDEDWDDEDDEAEDDLEEELDPQYEHFTEDSFDGGEDD